MKTTSKKLFLKKILKDAYNTAPIPNIFFVNLEAEDFITANGLGDFTTIEEVENLIEELIQELERHES